MGRYWCGWLCDLRKVFKVMDLGEALVLAGFTGLISSVSTVAAIKVDVMWIKDKLKSLDNRVTKLEGRL